MLFRSSSSNLLNHRPKGKAFVILNNLALKVSSVKCILFLKEAALYSWAVFICLRSYFSYFEGHDQFMQLNQIK